MYGSLFNFYELIFKTNRKVFIVHIFIQTMSSLLKIHDSKYVDYLFKIYIKLFNH